MGVLCMQPVCVLSICECDVDLLLILFYDVFITGSSVQVFTGVVSFEERRLANGSLGFSNGSPSLDMYLWAVVCGYLAGPGMVRLGPGLSSLLTWLSTLDIGVVVLAFGYAVSLIRKRARPRSATCSRLL